LATTSVPATVTLPEVLVDGVSPVVPNEIPLTLKYPREFQAVVPSPTFSFLVSVSIQISPDASVGFAEVH
jgi:hypothetical protein